jgi:hypothetical protein
VVVWILRATAVVLAFVSAFGFLNAFYFKMHGPGGDLGGHWRAGVAGMGGDVCGAER